MKSESVYVSMPSLGPETSLVAKYRVLEGSQGNHA